MKGNGSLWRADQCTWVSQETVRLDLDCAPYAWYMVSLLLFGQQGIDNRDRYRRREPGYTVTQADRPAHRSSHEDTTPSRRLIDEDTRPSTLCEAKWKIDQRERCVLVQTRKDHLLPATRLRAPEGSYYAVKRLRGRTITLFCNGMFSLRPPGGASDVTADRPIRGDISGNTVQC